MNQSQESEKLQQQLSKMVQGKQQNSLINIHIEKMMAAKLNSEARELEKTNGSSLSLLRNDGDPDQSSNFKTERRAIKRKMKKMLEQKQGENGKIKFSRIKLNRNGDRIYNNWGRTGRNLTLNSKAI